MKVIYIGVFRNDPKPAVELAAERDLSFLGYFQRSTVADILKVTAAATAETTSAGTRKATFVEKAGYYAHSHARSNGVCGVIVTDDEYPKNAAQIFLNKLLDEFSSKYPRTAYATSTHDSPQLQMPELKEYIKSWQTPAEDKMVMIQNDLDATKKTLQDTIQQAALRGEKLDEIIDKSNQLSASSKMFYTQAKKQNSCCIVM